ncbi:protein FAR1-RELATED SEQUENCE 6-like [Zingiber officinale]|uniref:protein FAR1-RELATED SEQUENCE 6-like n=1 Tax=Zingiber officinale TaxID=94328 RepID=UPI001C4CB8BC|nr:protein FAR1-RELATED SEQUENCE 6-like [Zingiber officinale]
MVIGKGGGVNSDGASTKLCLLADKDLTVPSKRVTPTNQCVGYAVQLCCVRGEESVMEAEKIDLIEIKDNNDLTDQDSSPSSVNEVKIPEIGMTFSCEEEVRTFYNSYAQNVGFGICKLGGRNGDDGKQKYFSIGCAKNGGKVSQAKNILYPRPSTKTNCKAKINVAIRNDGNFVITSLCLEHNHILSPGKSRHFRCNKVLDSAIKRKLELNDQAGITLSKSFQSFVVEAGGYENLTFDERKCRNYISEARRLRLGDGDAEALSNYFCRMQSRNSNFFYVLDLDGESRIKNIFWADARCRAAYEYFSDVVTFDTTYLTNSYDMPFAPFVGVNHHGQSILLGCGLLSSEDSATFIWLFKSWLTCMLGHAPKAIITDQCRAMTIAIEEVFPNSHHRLCLWHIMKKIPAKFGGHAQYKMIKKQLKNIVYNSLTIDECDENWLKMIEEFNLENNDWLKSLHEERHRWIPVYVKDNFWAGMPTSQRSESMNAFFDDYVHSKTSLKQFVEQYDNALKKKIENEKHLDFVSFNSTMPLILGHPIERQFQNAYTNNLFKLFQDEIRGLMFCDASLLKEEGTTLIFEVVETILGKNGEPVREVSFRVHYTELDCKLKCMCRLFEFRGILCRHVIKVLIRMKVTEVPMNYIMDRWRKDIKRGYQSISNIYDDFVCDGERHRYNILTPLIQEIQQLGAKNDDNCSMLVEILKDTKEKLIVNGLEHSRVEQLQGVSTSDSKAIHSPLKVRSRGRPPTKRKQSKIEQIVKKSVAKARKEAIKIGKSKVEDPWKSAGPTGEVESTQLVASEDIVSKLAAIGFNYLHCQKAAINTANAGVEEAMTWLLSHMDDPDIDEPISHNSHAMDLQSLDETSVETFFSFGFHEEVARKALKHYKKTDI